MLSGVTSYWTGSGTQTKPLIEKTNHAAADNPLEDVRRRLRENEVRLQKFHKSLNKALDKINADQPLRTFNDTEVEEESEDESEDDMTTELMLDMKASQMLKMTESKSNVSKDEAAIKAEADWMKQKDQMALKLPAALEHFLAGKQVAFAHSALIKIANQLKGADFEKQGEAHDKKTIVKTTENRESLAQLAARAHTLIFRLQALINDAQRFIFFCRNNQEKFSQALNVVPGEEFDRTVFNQTQKRFHELERFISKCFSDLRVTKTMLQNAAQVKEGRLTEDASSSLQSRNSSSLASQAVNAAPVRRTISKPFVTIPDRFAELSSSVANSPIHHHGQSRPLAPSPRTPLDAPSLTRAHSR
jgi:hypothetical protein